MEERTIDIKDMFWRTMLHWKMMLVAALIGAVLLDAYSYYSQFKKYKAYEKQVELGQSVSEEDIEKLKDGLKDKEIEDAEYAASAYKTLKQNVDAQTAYNNNSFIMQLDAQNVTRLTYTYYIDNGYKAEYPVVSTYNNIGDIVNAYISNLGDADTCTKIMDALGVNIEYSYIQELIIMKNPAGGTLEISVIGKDINFCRTVMSVLAAEIQEVTKELLGTYGKLTITQQSDKIVSGVDSDVLTKQTSTLTAFTLMRTNMQNIGSDLTGNALIYYEALTKNIDNIQKEKEPKPVSAKMIVVGIISGFFLMFILWLCVYVFNGKVKSGDDYEALGVKNLGTINATHKKKGISGWMLAKITDYSRTVEEQINYIGTVIKMLENAQDVVIVSTVDGICESEAVAKLISEIKKSGVNVKAVGSVLKDGSVIEAVRDAKSVIYIEKLGDTAYDELAKESQTCKMYKAEELGGIILV